MAGFACVDQSFRCQFAAPSLGLASHFEGGEAEQGLRDPGGISRFARQGDCLDGSSPHFFPRAVPVARCPVPEVKEIHLRSTGPRAIADGSCLAGHVESRLDPVKALAGSVANFPKPAKEPG